MKEVVFFTEISHLLHRSNFFIEVIIYTELIFHIEVEASNFCPLVKDETEPSIYISNLSFMQQTC